MQSSPFSRNQERPAWLVLRVNGESVHRAPLNTIDEMWGLFDRACAHFPERHVALVRLWGRPVAVAILVDGRLVATRTVGFTGEIRSDFERVQSEHPTADVRMVEVYGKRALRDELLGERRPASPDPPTAT